jgi:hypothetical protein
MSAAQDLVIPGLGTFTNRIILLNIFDRTNLIRLANGIGAFQATSPPVVAFFGTQTSLFERRSEKLGSLICDGNSLFGSPGNSLENGCDILYFSLAAEAGIGRIFETPCIFTALAV